MDEQTPATPEVTPASETAPTTEAINIPVQTEPTETPATPPETAPETPTEPEPSEPVVAPPSPAPAPEVPQTPQPDAVQANNDLLKAGEKIEDVLAHLSGTASIHHDVSELVAKLESARTWIANELQVAETIFGNPAAPSDTPSA